jgi:hypothetical protein
VRGRGAPRTRAQRGEGRRRRRAACGPDEVLRAGSDAAAWQQSRWQQWQPRVATSARLSLSGSGGGSLMSTVRSPAPSGRRSRARARGARRRGSGRARQRPRLASRLSCSSRAGPAGCVR